MGYIAAVTYIVLLSLVVDTLADSDGDADLDSLLDKLVATINVHKETEINEEKRIIGGETFDTGKWPWLVSLKGRVGFTTMHCGGSLLNDRWVLTAAHCFDNSKIGERLKLPRYWEARMGDKDLESSVWEDIKDWFGDLFSKEDWQDYEMGTEKIILHPEYVGSRNLWLNDIALIKLDDPVPSTSGQVSRVQAVQLPGTSLIQTNWPPDGEECIMKGWGCTKKGGGVSSRAKEVELPKVPDGTCRGIWGIQAIFRLCAGYRYSEKGICPGDSGGPLVCKHGDQWIQAGIASFTSKHYPGNFPGAFTRVTHYADWIQSTIANN